MGKVLVVQLYTHLSKDAKEKLRADLQRQLLSEDGIVILPPYTNAMFVPDDVELEIKDLPGGSNHFIGGEYYDGRKSKKRGQM